MSATVALVLSICSAVLAAFAFGFSVMKHQSEIQQSMDARARQSWDKYLSLAFEHPDLTETPGDRIPRKRYEQYEFFVYRFLTVADEVLSCRPKSEHWQKQVTSQIMYHAEYLKTWEITDWESFDQPLRNVVSKVFPNA
jgi:hypothetical protein